MPVDLGFCGAGLFGDLADAEVGPEPVDGAKRRLDDLSAHLLTVLAPAFAARVHLDPRLWPRVRQWRPGNSDHVKHLTSERPLTWADRPHPTRGTSLTPISVSRAQHLAGRAADLPPVVGGKPAEITEPPPVCDVRDGCPSFEGCLPQVGVSPRKTDRLQV